MAKEPPPPRWAATGNAESRKELPPPIATREEVINGQRVKVKIYASQPEPPDNTWVGRSAGRRKGAE